MVATRKGRPSPSTGQDFGSSLEASVSFGLQADRIQDIERETLCQRAPNIIEWIVREDYGSSPGFLGDGTEKGPPYWGAYQVLRDFFEIRCPICNTDSPNVWGRSKSQLEDEVLLRYSSSVDDDVCPKCQTTRRDFLEEGYFRGYNAFHLMCGMRVGKSTVSAYLGAYVEHVLLTIAHREKDNRGLQRYFGGPLFDQYDIAYVASSLKTGEESIWTKYRGIRNTSSWFRRYIPWVKTQERLQDTPDGMEKWDYSETGTKIKNGAVNLNISAFSANSDTLVGRTRILAAADEVGRMKDTDSALGADEIYRGLDHSLMTIRSAQINRQLPLPWLGLMASVSSPTSIDDKAMRLLKDAANAKRMFAHRAATWEFNPYQPRENFDEDFRKDPMGAQRDFGADPPMAASPLILDVPGFEESAVIWDAKPSATFKTYEFTDPTGRSYIGVKLDDAQLLAKGTPRYIAFDPGKTFDAFAGACAHAEYDEDGRLITVFDWVVRMLPRQGQEVWFEGAFDIVKDLQRFQHIQRVEFDHWHSSQLIQNIRQRLSIVSEEIATKDKHFIQFVRDAMSGRVKLLPPEEEDYDICPPERMSPSGVALYELERLDVATDGKIENPRKGLSRGKDSDDVARVIVHAHRMVQDIGYTERYDDTSRRARRLKSEALLQDYEKRGGGAIWSPKSVRSLMSGSRGRGW